MITWSISCCHATRATRAICLFALLFSAAPLRAQDEAARCDTILAAAESEYIRGEFDRAITLASECLSTAQVAREERVRAYRLLSLAYIRKEDLESAKLAVLELLSVAPDYAPDPIQDPPSYISLVDIVKQQLMATPMPAEPAEGEDVAIIQAAPAQRSWFRRHRQWVFAGGALLLAGTTGIILAGGGGTPGTSSLPLPPGLP